MNYRITRSFPEPHSSEEIEEFAESRGISVFYMMFDDYPLAIFSDTDIKHGDTITALVPKQIYNRVEQVWESRIFKSVDPARTKGSLFEVFEIC